MKSLEIIKKIMELNPNLQVSRFLSSDNSYNYFILCSLDIKYLNKRFLNFLIKNDNDRLSVLIAIYHEILDRMSKEDIYKLNGEQWVNILKKQPNLIDKYKVNLKFHNWANLIVDQPQLITKNKRLYISSVDNTNFLVKNNKEILKYIDIKKLKISYSILPEVLSFYPEYIEKVDKNKISNSLWVDILKNNPSLIEHCNMDSFTSSEIVDLVSNQSIFDNMLPFVDKIKDKDVVKLIINRPDLVKKLKISFNNIDEYDWADILEKQPQFIDKCDKLNRISSYDWVHILKKQPNLINHYDKIELNLLDWEHLIENHINIKLLIDSGYKYVIDEIIKTYPLSLLNKYPYLIESTNLEDFDRPRFNSILYNSKEHRLNVIEKYIKYFKDPEALTNMIAIYPDLKDFYTQKDLWKYVDFSKLTENKGYSILR